MRSSARRPGLIHEPTLAPVQDLVGHHTSGATITNQTVNGVYFSATKGNVFFLPNGTHTVGTVTSASATAAPAFDDRTFGTTGSKTIEGDGTHEVI